MCIRNARRKTFVMLAFLGLAVLLLSGCGALSASAAVLQRTLPSTSSATASVPHQPPSNIPVYPGARYVQTENVTFGKRPGQAWVYTVGATNLTLADVTKFYQQQMPAHGWKDVGSVVPSNATGPYGATVLIFHMPAQQQPTPTPSPMPGHHGETAIIAAGVNSQANPHEIGFVIALVK